ncbi:MAG: zinc metallopeptidase [Ruminococcaceae bacterium]|nr:zinc metallopeptidase [Oscillospiraceae bacterium]
MPFFYGIDTTYIIFVLPALIVAMWAQFNVNSTFNKFKTMGNRHGYTAHEVARKILDMNGLTHVAIERVSGHLSDHFDPKANVVRLSDSTYSSTSVAAIGVAAHEVGHAVQHATAYAPIKVRNTIVPVVQISSFAAFPLAIIGIIVANPALIWGGIILFSLTVLFQLVTLPVEFNASRRAIKTLDTAYILDENELKGAKKVLKAAALTYVASAAVAIGNLLRLLVLANGRNRD